MSKPRKKQIIAARLGIEFDPDNLVRDLNNLNPWKKEYRAAALHNGRYDDLRLVNPPKAGDPGTLCLTPLLRKTPYIREVMKQLKCSLYFVQLARLWPGGIIYEHPDIAGLDTGMVRLHIPIVTNDDVHFIIDGERQKWRPGELWFGDFCRLHSVENHSPFDRVHMIIGAELNPFLAGLFPEGFLKNHRALIAPETVAMPLKDLRRYECELPLGSAFLPGFEAVWTDHPEKTDISLRVHAGRLTAFIKGQPHFHLRPVGHDKFVIGSGYHKYDYEFTFSKSKISPSKVLVRSHGVVTGVSKAKLFLKKTMSDSLTLRSV